MQVSVDGKEIDEIEFNTRECKFYPNRYTSIYNSKNISIFEISLLYGRITPEILVKVLEYFD